MKVTIGKTFKDMVELDFDKTPHMIVGGTTRYGKTNLIKVMITDLIRKYGDDVEFYLFDLKKGVEFGQYKGIEQVKRVATDIEESVQLASDIVELVDERMRYFRSKGWNNVLETRGKWKKRTFIIVDEAGELAPPSWAKGKKADPYLMCQAAFSHISRLGAGFGFRQILCSQYTTGDVIPRECKQNSNAKICFRIQNGYASEVILDKGNTDAAYLDDIPGRAVFIEGPKKYELQVPLINDWDMKRVMMKWKRHKPTIVKDGETVEANDQTLNNTIRLIRTEDS